MSEETTTEHAKAPYVQVFVALAVLTGIEFGISYLQKTPFVIIILLVIALAKAALVASVFMHVWFEKDSRLIVLISFIVPLIGAIILFFTVFSDYRGTPVN